MSKFSFNVFGSFSFSNVSDWGSNEDGSVFVTLCNDDNVVVAHLLIPPGIEEVTVIFDTPPFQGEFKVPKDSILRQLADFEVGEDDDQKVDEFLELIDQMWPSLSFEGEVWVNPIFAFTEYGHFRQTHIGAGKKMSWSKFLSAYADGSLWGESRFESVEFDAFGDPNQTMKESPLGCFIAPEKGNRAPQPTDQQVYVVGKGYWTVRGCLDPSSFSWAIFGEDCKVQGVIPELMDVPIELPK